MFNLYFCLCGKLFNSAAASFPSKSSWSSYFSSIMIVNLLFKTFDISLITSSSASMISAWLTFFNDTDFYLTAAYSFLHFFDGADSSSIVNDSYCHQSQHGVLILNRSNKYMFLYWKIYWNQQVFDLIRASRIWMKPETLCHQASSSKFRILFLEVLLWI